MKILALKERVSGEKRVSLTPDLVSKYTKIGHEVFVESKAGESCGLLDKDFTSVGAKIISDVSAILPEIDIILSVQLSGDFNQILSSKVKSGVVVIGIVNPYNQKENLEIYSKNNVSAIAVELFPRITRAQSIDVLSSQSNLAGYRAVIDAVYELDVATPMMMTAAGTVSPAKIMIIGAGVAGLQAIATAKRLGAVVSAFDVRAVAKEQVESLGAKFIEVKNEEGDGEGKGGYAKEMSEDYKRRQEQVIMDHIVKQDVVITTALIPGKPAPKIVKKEMVEKMKSGSVIIDMAAAMGGNCDLTKQDEIVIANGVKIVGYSNIPSRVALDSSRLYAKNLYNFIELFTDKETKVLKLDLEDEIIKSSLVSHQGKVLFS